MSLLKMDIKCFVLLFFVSSAALAADPGAKRAAKALDSAAVMSFLDRYTELVKANYKETVAKAKSLQTAIEAFVKSPSAANLEAAKEAWKVARLIYSKTEAYRFYGGPIDNADTGPEGFVNAWPMDEAYVDYVEGQPQAGIINNKAKFPKVDKETLRGLNEKDGETNIATGFHAIEFLLWGQDLSKTGPGERPFTDFVDGKKENSDRRKQYLQAVTSLLVEDLEKVNKVWQDGSFPKELKAFGAQEAMQRLMTGLTTLSFDEMAGERMTVAIGKKDQENEQDCFSDFSFQDLHANQLGIQEVWEKADLKAVFKNEGKTATKISKELAQSEKSLKQLKKTFDQMVTSQDRKDIQTLEKIIKGLRVQARSIGKLAKAYDLELNVQDED